MSKQYLDLVGVKKLWDATKKLNEITQDVSKEHTERIETLETKENSMQTTLENISKTGEASAASNVTYNHSDSKLDATNVQQAVDEVKALLDTKANKVDVVFDISAYHATGGTLATYADLTAALGTNGKNIPQSLIKGGMSVKFVQTSGNKYVLYRLMNETFSTTESDWQGVDDEPTAGSDNLVKSGGVAEELALGAVYDVSAKNPTAGVNNDGKWESLSALLSDTNLSALIPTPVRKGGMSIKFVQSSDNKYVQYRLKTPYFSIYKFNWEKYTAVDVQNQNETDLDVSDEAGNVIVRVKEGEIKTKNFDSRNLKIKNTNNSEIDYAVSDENNNLIVEFSGGHVKTKNFDSRHITHFGTTHFGTFSIIGDSYSAFSGYSGQNDNAMWYPNPSSENNVLEIEQMWFYKFANEYKTALVQNDSYSGSTICYDGYKEGHDADFADKSFCRRIERFITPCELLLIFGGTNDSWAGSSIGDYKYSDWTEDDKSYFRPALAYLIDYVNKHHIGTQIVFILNNGLSSNINTSIETICEHYSVPILKLSNIDKTSGHPNVNGMTSISEQLTYFLNHF